MKLAVQKIDRAVKSLYNIDFGYHAENFLLRKVGDYFSLIGNADFHGALLIKTVPRSKRGLSVGIYLSDKVSEVLSSYPNWKNTSWSHEQLSAFSVASEEISHFHYFLYHALRGRSVSQLELELQGEIDKFVLSYLAAGENPEPHTFDELFEKLFYRFHLSERLSTEQKERYLDANRFARQFIRKYGQDLAKKRYERLLALLRKFYRLTCSEKIRLCLIYP